MFSYLFSLTNAKKLLIVRVYVLINYRRIKKCQYKYFDYVINFMQNITKIVIRLFLLFSKLQILILKFVSSIVKNNVIHQKFERIFRIRCDYVEFWLKYLIANHSNYQKFKINQKKLFQLSINDIVMFQLNVIEKSNKNDDNDKIVFDMFFWSNYVKSNIYVNFDNSNKKTNYDDNQHI